MPDICDFLLDQSSLEGSPTAKGPHRKNTQCFLVIKIVLGWAAPVLSLYLVTVNAYCGICCSLLFSFQYVILILSTTSGYPSVHPKHAVSQSLPLFSFSYFLLFLFLLSDLFFLLLSLKHYFFPSAYYEPKTMSTVSQKHSGCTSLHSPHLLSLLVLFILVTQYQTQRLVLIKHLMNT